VDPALTSSSRQKLNVGLQKIQFHAVNAITYLRRSQLGDSQGINRWIRSHESSQDGGENDGFELHFDELEMVWCV